MVNLCVVSTQATAAGSTRAPKFPNLHAKVPGVVGLAHDRLDLTLHQSIPRIQHLGRGPKNSWRSLSLLQTP